MLITGYGILFVVGINWKIWTVIFIVLGLSAPLLYNQLKPYQKKRISDFVGKPSYQVNQALIAIGSGGLEGKGKEEATQTQLDFLPVSSTDFIFAFLGFVEYLLQKSATVSHLLYLKINCRRR